MATHLNLGDTKLIIAVCRARSINRMQTAYILATAYWETNKTMKPVIEAYWLSEAWRKKNLRYYPYHGRGYVQLTWKENYIRAGKRLGYDFVKHPEKLLEPEIAARVLVIGMEEGWFTGKKLSSYIDSVDESDEEDHKEYVQGRRIVNGTDRAQEIADLALIYEYLLIEIGYGESEVVDDDPIVEKRVKSTHPILQLIIAILKLLTGGRHGT